ncbi:lipopolysaccharide-induced tumor necrosis factor-alpha factor homolog [Pimephales promelas]|uniref:lipopolysaccharide-induced tumor necrosis factor-alpha factor homolog n=1 Tax=Pimephales promelas TaxID=90988 RepID=UPI001955BD21|nr:lipopolysaccharide-induced tumor necrosis factor-alpha factor homolog [Pimephales promelas]
MEKEHNPPPYFNAQPTQTGVNYPGPQAHVNYPGPQAHYPPQTGPHTAPYQPPPYGFGAPPTNFQPVMVPVVTQSAVVSLTDVPGHIICPHCMTEVLTEIEYLNGLLTWLICGVLGFFLCWICCCIPFCMESCKDVKHTCPNCKNIIRIYKRIQ